MGSTARQLAADDTRKRLYAAAVSLFGSAGYHATTVDAIAKRAGVAKGTFFLHFSTKNAVVLELVRGQTEVAHAARAAALPDGPVAGLRATVLALAEQAGRSRELSRAVFAAALEDAEISRGADALFGLVLDSMIADARAAKLPRGVDPEMLARGLMAAYVGAAYQFTSSRKGVALADILEPLVDTLLEGSTHATRSRPARAVTRR